MEEIREQSIISAIYVILGYSFVKNKYCGGLDMATYSTLALAISACDDNDECGSITDYGCKDVDWITCSGRSLQSSSEGACSWLKPMKPRKLCALKILE